MEDLLYIFLAVIWLVISILGSKKKKKEASQSRPQPKPIEQQEEATPQEPTPQPTAQKEQEVDFEELLEEFFGGGTKKKQQPTQEAPQPAPAPAYTEERTYYDEKPEFRRRKEQEADKPREIKKFEGSQAITEDYEFSAEGKVETIEDLIQSYDDKYKKTEEEDQKIRVVDLDEEEFEKADLEFDGRKAIIYSEIIKRKYF